MREKNFTSIRLTTETRDRLKTRGMKGEDYDTIIVKLLNATESEKIEQGNPVSVPVQA